MELELSFTRSPVSEVTVRRFGAKVFCWLSTTPPNTDTVDDGCFSFCKFWERENSLEKRVRCGKAMPSYGVKYGVCPLMSYVCENAIECGVTLSLILCTCAYVCQCDVM